MYTILGGMATPATVAGRGEAAPLHSHQRRHIGVWESGEMALQIPSMNSSGTSLRMIAQSKAYLPCGLNWV